MKRSVYQIIKRAFDLTASAVGLIVLSPLLLILALLVRVNLGSPVLFSQERPGLHGKIFRLYKFRSMKNAADSKGNLLPDEERLSRFGRILRASSLDELPELFCVLKGDMSLVGPRPLLVKYLPLYNEKQKHRHDVRPGLTGYAQSNGRNAITWEEKFEYDVEYVNNISFNMDANIILKTIKSVLKKEGIGGKEDIIDEFKGSVQEYV